MSILMVNVAARHRRSERCSISLRWASSHDDRARPLLPIWRRHTNLEGGLDLYETPAVAVEALPRVERLPHLVWEPAAGRGAIVRVLQAYGYNVAASDIMDYGFLLRFVGDFLTTTTAPNGCTTPSSEREKL